ncbi:MAG: hypothetical protein ACPGO5_04430 [Patescibacteria group bacterium]
MAKKITQAKQNLSAASVAAEADMSEDDAFIAAQRPTAKFPYFMLAIAGADDFIDLLELTGVGLVLTKPFSIVVGVILFIWMLGKTGMMQKKLIRWLATFLVEISFGIVPANILLVLFTHYRDKKVVILFWNTVRALEGKGFKVDVS